MKILIYRWNMIIAASTAAITAAVVSIIILSTWDAMAAGSVAAAAKPITT